jgi:hypothetical protein
MTITPLNTRLFLKGIRNDKVTPSMIMENDKTASDNAHSYMIMKIKHEHIRKNNSNNNDNKSPHQTKNHSRKI